MPRQSSIPILDTSTTVLIPLESIPADVIAYVEEVYKRQLVKPGRERAVYDTEDELKTEFKLMVDYAAQRPEGILKVRKSPTRTKDLPEDLRSDEMVKRVMDFRITADLEANAARNGGKSQDGNKPDGAKDGAKK